jgi:hypothetical protein
MFMAQCFVRKILDLSPYNFNRVLSYLLLSTDKTTAKEREATLLSVVKSCSDNRYNQDKILQLAENAHLYVFFFFLLCCSSLLITLTPGHSPFCRQLQSLRVFLLAAKRFQ